MKKLSPALVTSFLASSLASAAPGWRNPLDCAPTVQPHDCPQASPWSTDEKRLAYCEVSAVAPVLPGYDAASTGSTTRIPTPVVLAHTPMAEPIVNPVVAAPPSGSQPFTPQPLPPIAAVTSPATTTPTAPTTQSPGDTVQVAAPGGSTSSITDGASTGSFSSTTPGSTSTGTTTNYGAPGGSSTTTVTDGSSTIGSTTSTGGTAGTTTTVGSAAPDTLAATNSGSGIGTIAGGGSTTTTTGSAGTVNVNAATSTAPYITSVVNMPVSNTATGAASGAQNRHYYFAQMSGGSYVPPGPCNEYGCGGTVQLSYTIVGNDVVFFAPSASR